MRYSYPKDAFSRKDETDDTVFYARDRFVSHLDAHALETIRDLVGQLVVEERPAVLDLMASWDSHLPESIRPSRVAGLGLNERELAANKALTEHRLQDLNRDPRLPYPDAAFDVVLCTVSVDYLTRPAEVFREVGRVLRPGGLFLVIFSNRFFPPKVVKIWREAGEDERMLLVRDFLAEAGGFDRPEEFISRGFPRPPDDKYAGLGIPSDPVYAVYASRSGGTVKRPVPKTRPYAKRCSPEQVAARKRTIRETLRCPYCRERLEKWAVPQTPFTEWPNPYMYVCFNDACCYYVEGWEAMAAQGNWCSYRFMYNPESDAGGPIPVQHARMLRDGIVNG